MRRLLGALVLIASLGLFAKGASAEDYLFFKMLEVERGGQRAKVLFPHMIHFDQALPANDLVMGLMAEMAKGRELLYAKLEVGLPSLDVVEIRFTERPTPEMFPAIAEIYHSMRFNGFKEVRFTAPDGTRIDWGAHPYPAFLPVVSYLGTLDSIPFPDTVVSLGEGTWLTGDEFEAMRKKQPWKVKKVFGDAFTKGHSLVKLYLLERLDKVPLANREQALIALLKDPDPAVRLSAIELLRAKKTNAVIKALEKVVDQDDNADVKTRAVLVLDGFGIKKYRIFILFDKLKSDNEAEVMDAIEQLVASKNPKVVIGLATVLGHYSESVRARASDAIVGFNDTKVMASALDDPKADGAIKARFAQGLAEGSFRDLKMKGLAYLLASGSEEQKVAALDRIRGERLTAMIDKVSAAVDDPSDRVASAAVMALAEFKDKSSLKRLAAVAEQRKALAVDIEQAVIQIVSSMRLDEVIALAKSDNFTLRKFATKSLVEFTKSSAQLNPKVRVILEERMLDANIEIKRAAVYALARAKHPDIVKKLVQLVDDPDDEIREQVMVSLNQLPYAGAEDVFIKKLDDTYDPVRLQAIKGIRQLKVASAVKKLTWLRNTPKVEIRREVVAALFELMPQEERKRHFDMFAEGLYDMDPEIKTTAMRAIAGIRDPRVAPTLSSLVLDPNKEVKLAALDALAGTGDPAAVEYIVQGLFDLDTDTKKAALAALKKLHVSAAEKPLQEFVKNESDAELRKLAEDVLYSLP